MLFYFQSSQQFNFEWHLYLMKNDICQIEKHNEILTYKLNEGEIEGLIILFIIDDGRKILF